MASTSWRKVPVSRLPSEAFGRPSAAFAHRDGRTVLILHRPQSRGGQWCQRIGWWCLLIDRRLVRRRAAYGRRSRGAPWRWANAVRRDHLAWCERDAAASATPPPSTFEVAFHEMPVSFDELPAVLAGHNLHGGVTGSSIAREGDPVVPMALPTVLPWRALSPRWTKAVLSKEECHAFLDTWRAWAAEPGALADPARRAVLEEICLATVVLRRYEAVCGRDLGRRLAAGYDRACLRYRQARERFRGMGIGATVGLKWTDLLAATAVCTA
jgi:hypothetical protein